MEAALTPTQPPDSFLARLSMGQKIAAAIGLASLAAVAAAAYLWSQTPNYKILFANLSDRDGGAVIATLTQMNIPYKMTEGGGAIMVPAEQVHDLRLRLASQGLPKGGTVGFELLENQKFGVTQFQERMNYQRGLEGELARSIQSLAAVSSARVHLALPAQSGFFRDQQKPSASVVVSLHAGHTLDRARIAGIVHLVASSVHDLNPKQVSVIDQTGNLLSDDGDNGNGHDASQLQFTRNVENTHAQRVIELLEPLVGKGNVRAQVSADLDFSQSESTAEQYKPNQNPEQAAIRSQQTSEGPGAAGGNAATASGVPGALSNQPAPAASAPANGAAQPVAGAQNAAPGAAGAAAGTTARQRDATTNYELDKTVRVTRNPSGTTRRLSVAVVLNDLKKVDEQGKASYTPISQERLAQMTSLVKDAVGFNKDRGDSVSVVNAAFTAEAQTKDPEVPIWKQAWVWDIAKEVGKYTGLLLLALIIINKAIKPVVKAAQEQAEARRVNATVANPLELGDMSAQQGVPLDRILLEARQDPAAVANVVKTWAKE